jgi:O-antigen/teichoic acid export membrane protein
MIQNIKVKIYNLLRLSEKLFKTDMVYLFKGGFWLSMGQFFSSLSAFLLSIAFAYYLSKDDYGTYKYVLSITGILAISTLRGINVSITQSVAQGNDGTALSGIKTKMKWGFLGTIAALGLGSYYFLNNNSLLGTLIIICAPFLPFKDAFGAYQSILNGKKDFRRIAIFNTISAIIYAISTFLVLYLTRSIKYTILFYFITWTLINYVLLKVTIKRSKLNNSKDTQSINYGRNISALFIVSTIAGYFDKLLAFHFLGAASVAVLAIAQAPVSQITSALGNINVLAAPKFSQLATNDLKKSINQKTRAIIIITAAISLVYLLSAKFLFGIFFPKYEEAVLYTQILTLSAPLVIASRFQLTAIQSRFDEKAFRLYTWFSSLTQIILILIFGYFFGLFGIALSYIMTDALQFIATFYIIRRLKPSSEKPTLNKDN